MKFYIIIILLFSLYNNLANSNEPKPHQDETLKYFSLYNKYFEKYNLEKDENDKNISELEVLNTKQNDFDKLKIKNKNLENIKIIKINRSILIIFFVTIIISILVILFLSLLINRQKKWRQRYFDENKDKYFIGQLPERIAETIDSSEAVYENLLKRNEQQYNNFKQNLQQVVNMMNQFNTTSSDNTSKINEQLSSLRKFSDEKNELVKKYQEFYDLGVLKSFIFEIISAIDNLEDSIKKLMLNKDQQTAIDPINLAKDQLIILLENENIEQISPNLLIKYNSSKQPIKMKVMKSIHTDDGNLVGDICEVLHSGYLGHIGKDETKLIREAYVSVYIQNNRKEDSNG